MSAVAVADISSAETASTAGGQPDGGTTVADDWKLIIQILAKELVSEDARSVTMSMRLLSLFFWLVEESDIQITSCNGASLAVYQTMVRFPENFDVQRSGISTLRSITSTIECTQLRHNLIEYGVLDLCLAAMKKCNADKSLTNTYLLCHACELLGNLIVDQTRRSMFLVKVVWRKWYRQ